MTSEQTKTPRIPPQCPLPRFALLRGATNFAECAGSAPASKDKRSVVGLSGPRKPRSNSSSGDVGGLNITALTIQCLKERCPA
jgi:hypothetical protein